MHVFKTKSQIHWANVKLDFFFFLVKAHSLVLSKHSKVLRGSVGVLWNTHRPHRSLFFKKMVFVPFLGKSPHNIYSADLG